MKWIAGLLGTMLAIAGLAWALDWLEEQGVQLEERDIALAELVAIAGKNTSIPVTVIGKKVVGGFAPAELRRALAAARR